MKTIELPDELHTQVYLPESQDDCHKISCSFCICAGHKHYDAPCQFNKWLATHPVEEPTDTINDSTEPKLLRRVDCIPTEPTTPISARKQMIDECNRRRSAESNTVINPIGIQILLNEINQNIINLNKTQHEQQVPEHQKTDSSKIEFTCGKGDSMGHLLSEYEVVEKDQVGDLNKLLYLPNANDAEYGKDFYHRCGEMNRKLVRLLYDEVRDEHKCPLCKEVFLPK